MVWKRGRSRKLNSKKGLKIVRNPNFFVEHVLQGDLKHRSAREGEPPPPDPLTHEPKIEGRPPH